MTDNDNKDPQITAAQMEGVINWLESRPQAAWYISEQEYDAAINTWASRGTELIPIIEQLSSELKQLRAERAGLLEFLDDDLWPRPACCCQLAHNDAMLKIKSRLTDSVQRVTDTNQTKGD